MDTAINAFRLCSGLKFLGYLMILLVLGIIGVTYDAVVVLTWAPHLLDGGTNYIMVVLRDPGAVPASWKMSTEQNVGDGSLMSSISLAADSLVAMPSSSQGTEQHLLLAIVIGAKMESHQDVIIALFLYTFLETKVNTFVLLLSFIEFFRQAENLSDSPGKRTITFLTFVLNLAFALSLLFFIIMHTSMVLSNTTSVEVHEKKKGVRWKYDLGWKKNIELVFGTRKALWVLPLFSKEDLERVPALHGLDFPTRSDIEV